MNRIGLVMAGGGGKGAYQIGVWKYLRECGLDKHICAVSGTSVGALNAALFCTGDYSAAENIWLNIAPHKILSPRKITKEDAIRFLVEIGINSVRSQVLIEGVTVTISSIVDKFRIMLLKRYGFSRDGLLEIMNDEVDFASILSSGKPCFATCFDILKLKPERFNLQDYGEKDSKNILLASSAIPIVFDSVKIQGKHYYDGGLPLIGDNIPIAPLYNMGIENIIVVHLSQDSCVERKKYPETRLIEIVPQVELGGPVNGTLDFTSKGSRWRIDQGYTDAKRIFGAFVEQVKIGKMNQMILQAFLQSEKLYNQKSLSLQREKEIIKQQRKNDGFDEMCKNLGIKNKLR